MTWRVLVLCDHNPFPAASGSTAYLKSVLRGLKELRCTVGVSICRLYAAQPVDASLHGLGVDQRIMRSIRVGERLITSDPLFAARRLAALATGTRHRPRRAWRLARLGAGETRYAMREIKRFRPDVVISNYFPCIEDLATEPDVPVIVLTHDLFALRQASFRSVGKPEEVGEEMVRRERDALDHATAAFYISEDEFKFGAGQYAARPFYLPHCVNMPDDAGRPRDGQRSLFIGTAAAPNVDALSFLLGEIWPLVRSSCPEAQLDVVGAVAHEWTGPNVDGVTLHGVVGDLDAFYKRAKVCVAPLRVGSGLKVKIVEALAHGCPVVTTQAGAKGLGQAASDFLRIEDIPESFAMAALEFLMKEQDSPARRAAANFARTRYGSETMTARLEECLGAVLGAGRSS